MCGERSWASVWAAKSQCRTCLCWITTGKNIDIVLAIIWCSLAGECVVYVMLVHSLLHTLGILLLIVSLPSPIKSLLFESMKDADVTWWLLLLCKSSSLMSSLPNARRVSDDPGGLDITGRGGGLLMLLLRGGACRCAVCCFAGSLGGRCGLSFILDAFRNIRPSNGGMTNASSTASIQTVMLPTFLKYRKWYFPGIGNICKIVERQIIHLR